jgi:hydroxyacylglutathione hydrolase
LARIAELAAHRRLREAQVLAALALGPATPLDLARRIYVDLASGLLPAAARNVLAHLIDLASRNRTVADPEPGRDALWRLA